MKNDDPTRASFEATYNELVEPIFRHLFFKLGDRERARELAQETFMKTWLYIKDGGTIKHMRAFLYATANNLFKNELRSKRDTVSLDVIMETTHFEPETTEASADTIAETNILKDMLTDLKPEYREVLVLRYIDGLNVGEIAEVLGESPVSVSVRIHRARKKLMARYER